MELKNCHIHVLSSGSIQILLHNIFEQLYVRVSLYNKKLENGNKPLQKAVLVKALWPNTMQYI